MTTGTTNTIRAAARLAAIERMTEAHKRGMPDSVMVRRFHLSASELEDIVGRDDDMPDTGVGGY